MKQESDLVVLIPTVNESSLEELVQSVREQIAGEHIYLLGFGRVRSIAEKSNCHFINFGKQVNKSIAINHAVSVLPYPRFIILDADAFPEPRWLQSMERAFHDGREFFSGSVDISQGNHWMRVYNLSMMHEFLPDHPAGVRRYVPAISLGFTRNFYLRNGPFLETINRSQDFEWSLRSSLRGEPPFFYPDAVVRHIPISKSTFSSVIASWYSSAYDNWKVRLAYRTLLRSPQFLQWPWGILLIGPFISIGPTIKIFFVSPKIAMKNLYLLPFLYLTKLAWCIGVFVRAVRLGKRKQ
jgi:hypothetical protein